MDLTLACNLTNMTPLSPPAFNVVILKYSGRINSYISVLTKCQVVSVYGKV